MKTKTVSIVCAASLLVILLAGCGKNEPSKTSETVSDVCGNKYPVVKVGYQYWMGENLRCNRYDSNSERPGVSLTMPDAYAEQQNYAPYYVDASKKEYWVDDKYASELSEAQIAKLGYLYNYAAAVGLEKQEAYDHQGGFKTLPRQGICPNGWHLPTKAEIETLYLAIDGENYSGLKILSKSGWYGSAQYAQYMTDEFGFSALPAGEANNLQIKDVGGQSFFRVVEAATGSYFNLMDYKVFVAGCHVVSGSKTSGCSVRCIRND